MRAVLCLIIGFATACGSGANTMNLPRCTTYAECEAHDQKRVEVIGTYRLWSPRPGKSADDARQVRIVFDPSTTSGPFLEAGDDKRHLRSPDEIAKFRERQVRVVGTFVRQMPQNQPPEAAQLGGSCISDVESIELVEER
jgi:hypothetical protein